MAKDKEEVLMYQLESVEKCPPPEGITGGDWYYYVIVRGISRIDGKRSGTLKQVNAHAKDLADRINKRNDKYGMVFVTKPAASKQS